jgi:ribonuclease Z
MTSKESVDGFNEVEMAEVTIRSSDVLAPSKAGNSFAQVYLPSIDYLDDFLSARTQTYLQAAEPLHVLVHAVHPTVMRDGRYQAFMAKHTHTHHFVASRSFVPDRIGYPSAALATLRMSYLDEILFKVPQYSLTASESLARYDSGSGSIQACPLDVEISLHPQRAPQLIEDSCPDFLFAPGSAEAESLAAFQSSSIVDLQKQKAEMERWRRFLEISSQLQEDESKRNSLNMDQSDATTDISITTLGTGSALPSKYRNVSGTLLHLPKDAGYILLDCGEGTYGQLCRRFGKDIDEVIRNIRCIFISHIHGDHHMGMARLLSERLKLDVADKILYVLSTSYVRNYLLEVSDIEGLGICAPEKSAEAESGVIFLDIAHFKVSKDKTNGNGTSISPNAWAEKEEVNVLAHLDNLEHGVLPDVRIQSAEVDHRASHCYGIVLRGKGWSVAYSGDTRPSTNLIEASKGVDILIHEATFEDGQEEMATKKGHSTVGQAIEVGKKAGVRRILLTHFSQRYPKIPRIADTLAEEAIAGAEFASPAVSIAFDLMTLRPSDFGKTERYREALQVLFDEGGEDGDDGGNGGEGADSGRKTTQTSKKNSSAASKDPHARSNKETATKVSNVGGASEAAQQDADLTDNLEKVRWKRSQEQPQRKYVKEQEFAYVVTHIEAKAAATSSKSSLAMPARLAFSDRLDRVTEELHGLVGCSFHRDILQFDTVALPGRSPFVQAVIKVASAYAQHLVSALSSGVVLKVEGATFVSNYVGTLNSHQLSTTKGLYATDSTKSSSSISSAPGRAWMEEFVVSKST